MTDTAARAEVLRDAMQAAVTGDPALVERVYTEDVTGWSPVLAVASRDQLAADLANRTAAFSDVDLALDPVDEVGDKHYWNEVELIDGLGLLPSSRAGGAPTGWR